MSHRVAPRTTYGPPKTSKRTRAEHDAIRKWREAFRREIGRCELCGHHPRNPWRDKPMQCSVLTVNEIARGNGRRGKSLTYRGGVLCTCWWCNSVTFDDASVWPIARQLALLKVRRPDDYDVEGFAKLIRPTAPQWVTDADVSVWLPTIEEFEPTWRE